MSKVPPGGGRMPFGLPGAPRSSPGGRDTQSQGYGSDPLGFSNRDSNRFTGGGYEGVANAPRPTSMSRGGYEKNPPRSPLLGRAIPLQLAKVEDKNLQTRLIYENVCAVSQADFNPNPDGSDIYVLIQTPQGGSYVISARPIPGFPPGCIALSEPQRTWQSISLRDQFTGTLYDPFSQGSQAYLGEVDLELGFASPAKKSTQQYDEDELAKMFTRYFQNQVLQPKQRVIMDVAGIPLLIVVKTVTLMDLSMSEGGVKHSDPNQRGILTTQTKLAFFKDAKGDIQLKPSMTRPNTNAIIAPDFKFSDLGIGGLADEFSTIFRRAFASRVFPPALVQKLGIQHVKGILLYGPPGTGKTLMARQIGKMLNAREPKIINGPEILNKYVGQSEENVRKMFADAEKEYKEKGDESGLHVIIFDELDAVCKQRGSTAGGTGVGDSVVNQLLTKLDGVDQLNNILLIGMTNRKDMIDEALLRPGRLEVQLEISLPNEGGRLEILKIHTSAMLKSGVLGNNVNLEELAGATKNFSGAEIAGLVKAATSFAFTRHTKVDQLASFKDIENMQVVRDDFMSALVEVKPAFGVQEEDLDAALPMGFIRFNPEGIDKIIADGETFCTTVANSTDLRHMSVLFAGHPATGKTALAARIAQESGFPFIKLIGPKELVQYRDDFAKKDYLHKVFTDAYKSPLSLIILDDIENLIEWSPVGARFSNTILQALITLIRTAPDKGRRLLIFVTTSQMPVLKLLEIDTYFGRQVRVQPVQTLDELNRVVMRAQHPMDETKRLWSTADIEEVLNRLQDECIVTESERRAGVFTVGLGIKTVLEFVAEAKVAVARGLPSKDLFVDKMKEAIDNAKAIRRAMEEGVKEKQR